MTGDFYRPAQITPKANPLEELEKRIKIAETYIEVLRQRSIDLQDEIKSIKLILKI